MLQKCVGLHVPLDGIRSMFYLDLGLFDEDLCILYRMLSELRLIRYPLHAKYLYRLYVCRQTESEIGGRFLFVVKDDKLW